MSVYNNNVLKWLQSILCERFSCVLLLSQPDDYHLKLSLPEGKGAIYFDSLVPEFFSSAPDIPYSEWNPEEENFSAILNMPLPVPGNERLTSPVIEMKNNDHVVHYDILGLVYWMLSRQEEVGVTALDRHGRFPATSSHAYRHGYLDRPVVDEWLDILGQVLTRQWPQLKLQKHVPRTMVTCDADSPNLSYC